MERFQRLVEMINGLEVGTCEGKVQGINTFKQARHRGFGVLHRGSLFPARLEQGIWGSIYREGSAGIVRLAKASHDSAALT